VAEAYQLDTLKVGGRPVLVIHRPTSNEPGELWWQCYDNSTINVVVHYHY